MTINRIPLGLIGFLGIKNFGQYPQNLTRDLVPTWDVGNLYLNSSATYLQVVSTINATGYTIVFSAPQNESWWISDYSTDIATGVGETWQGTLARATPNNNGQVRLRDDRSLVASQWLAMAAPVREGFILGPGESLGVLTNQVTGVIDLVAQVRFTILTS